MTGIPLKQEQERESQEEEEVKMLKEEGGTRSYLGAGMRACAAMRKRSMMKEQTRLELNISSLIWENWATRNTEYSEQGIHLLQAFSFYLGSPCSPCGCL